MGLAAGTAPLCRRPLARINGAAAAAPCAEGSVAASGALLTDAIRPAASGARVAPAGAGFTDAFLPTDYWRALAVFGL
ncbi:hypothetical protein J2803_005616 [Paraburkholderia phenoliruptrix]|nr:hypothetical protein [Paraburkholderia phenoliruptrix]